MRIERWLGSRIAAADFDPLTGTLYGIGLTLYGSPRLVTINTNTGQAAAFGKLSKEMGVFGSMVFNEAGTIIGSGGFASGMRSSSRRTPNDQISRPWKISDWHFIPQGLAFALPCGEAIQAEIDIKPGSTSTPSTSKAMALSPWPSLPLMTSIRLPLMPSQSGSAPTSSSKTIMPLKMWIMMAISIRSWISGRRKSTLVQMMMRPSLLGRSLMAIILPTPIW